jgi:hypothetical protein
MAFEVVGNLVDCLGVGVRFQVIIPFDTYFFVDASPK